MRSEYYSKFSGIDQVTNREDAPQNSYLKLDNIVLSDKQGKLTRRGGSEGWSATGSNLGMFGYSNSSGSALVPNTTKVLRHRRNGSTSFIEMLDHSTTPSTWVARTLGAQTAFGIDGIAQAAQYSNILVLCAGRPAYFSSTSSDINRLGGPAPTAAPTWGNSGTGLSGSTRGFYTFRNSTTGWESSPSPVTDLLIISNKQIDWSAMETSCAKEGVDKKRLYRTELTTDGAGTFKLVAEINLATTTYADTVASLGVEGPETGDHDPPPSTSYICITYANKIVIASDNELWFSKTYDPETHGINGGLEYFSLDRVRRFPAKITGLAFTPDFGKLLVFLPVGFGIHYVSGRSDDTFQQDIFKDKEGTNFTPSVSWHDDQVAYWGANGPSIVNPSGTVTDLSRGLNLKDFIETEYSSTVYVSSAHVTYPTSRFVFALCATQTDGVEWEDSVTGVSVGWEDTVTGATVTWELN